MPNPVSFLFLNDLDNQPLFLEKPIHRILATRAEEVLSSLQQVDDWIKNKKYYIAGYLTYEAGYALMGLPSAKIFNHGPLVDFYVFEQPAQIPNDPGDHLEACFFNFATDENFETYSKSLQKIHEQIFLGNTYQVNYTFKKTCQSYGSLRALFNNLYRAQQSRYSVLAQCVGRDILSLSPELFFSRIENKIVTKPMKGTLPLGINSDPENIDSKLRAENLMIVDLLRNDLSKVAQPETVHATQLLQVEKYPTLQQLVSTIEGTVDAPVTFSQLMSALFPCGSITGAPKYRTMEIINSLEREARGVYTGTVGCIYPQGNMQFSVAIRTLESRSDSWTYGIGGGIVLNSHTDDEYDEALLKSQFIHKANSHFSLFETLVYKEGLLQRLDDHLRRLQQSAINFGFLMNEVGVRSSLKEACKDLVGEHRLKLQLFYDGHIHIETHPLDHFKWVKKVAISTHTMNSKNLFLKHKSSVRPVYDKEFLSHREKGFYDVLFLNERKEVTEGSRHNIFIKKGNMWYTPPVSCGLLPGIMREHILKENTVEQAVLFREDLDTADEIWLSNSVRGFVQVELEK